MRRLNPDAIHPPFAKYAHGLEVDPGARIVFCSGQLGIGRDGIIPEDVEAQTRLCFRAIAEILGEVHSVRNCDTESGRRLARREVGALRH